MKIENGTVTLSTGRTFWPNRGLLSVDAEGVLHGGYDDSFEHLMGPETPPDVDPADPEDAHLIPFTSAERAEIGEFMLRRWADWMGAVEVRVIMSARLDHVAASIGFAGETTIPEHNREMERAVAAGEISVVTGGGDTVAPPSPPTRTVPVCSACWPKDLRIPEIGQWESEWCARCGRFTTLTLTEGIPATPAIVAAREVAGPPSLDAYCVPCRAQLERIDNPPYVNLCEPCGRLMERENDRARREYMRLAWEGVPGGATEAAEPKPEHPAPWAWVPWIHGTHPLFATAMVDAQGGSVLVVNGEFAKIDSPLARELIRLAPEMEELLRGPLQTEECPWCKALFWKGRECEADCPHAAILAKLDAARSAR